MSISTDSILKSSQCLYNWLGYLGMASQNSNLIAESSLKYPFVEYFERHYISNIHLEVKHPLFQGRRIDAYIGELDGNTNTVKEQSSQMVFMEFKFVRGDTSSIKEQQRYFNDILRLSYLKDYYPSAKCFFLVCGQTDSFHNQFRYDVNSIRPNQINGKMVIRVDQKGSRKKISRKSIYNDWLPLKKTNPTHTFLLKKDDKFVQSFNDEYLSRLKEGISLPSKSKFTSKLLLLLPENGRKAKPYSLGLWEVK